MKKTFMDILFTEYIKHKKLLLVYMGILIFAAAFAGPFTGLFHGGLAYAQVPLGTTIETLLMDMVAPTLFGLAGSYSEVVGISCEPFAAMAFIGLVEILNNLAGNILPLPSTPLGNPVVCGVMVLFFIASKVIKAFPGTKLIGDCTLGELEKYLGLACVLVIGVMNVVGIVNTTSSVVVNAASDSNPTVVLAPVVGAICAAVSVIMSIASVVVYFIIKTVSQGLDVFAGTFSFIPGSGALFEALKTIITVAVVGCNLVFPPLGFIINLVVFIICCILFRRCYCECDYLRKIYIIPFFKRIRGFSPEISLVSEQFIHKFKKVKTLSASDCDVSIPAFVMAYSPKTSLKIKGKKGTWKVKPYTRGFLIHDGQGIRFVRKKKRKHTEVRIPTDELHTVYLRRGFRYFELFLYEPTPDNLSKKNPKKYISVVFSKEYYYRFEELLSIFKCVNFNEYEEEQKIILKKEKLVRKENRRMELENLKLERKLEKQRRKEEFLALKQEIANKRMK